MGHLFYGSSTTPESIPDRVLAHLKVVIATKLRRNESFTLTCDRSREGKGSTTLWLQPSIPLRFVFDSAETEDLDPGALTKMAQLASTSRGLVIDLNDRPEHGGDAASLPHVPERRRARASRPAPVRTAA
ncbi:DUF7882 family protein [Microbacterium sp.]|uniref:DUF7882 family protein n=1 Tax=Microbacterium sp. TaxID=51671 RepID=UPI00281128E4|nr:hypothetical protein [Microbacterium sp.]